MPTTNMQQIPKYEQLSKALKEKIVSGEWSYQSQIPPERELEKTYKASRPTVSKALSQLIQEGLIIREKGRGTFVKLDGRRIDKPVLFFHYEEPQDGVLYASHNLLLRSVESCLRKRGLRMMLTYFSDEENINTYTHSNHEESSVIAVGPIPSNILQAYQKQNIPVIVIDHEQTGVDCIALDNEGMAQSMVQYLYDRGHRNIMYIGNRPGNGEEWPNSLKRRRGYEDAMKRLGMTIPMERFAVDSGTGDEAIDLLKQVEKLPSACIFSSECVAESVFKYYQNQARFEGLPFTAIMFDKPKSSEDRIKSENYVHAIFDWDRIGKIAVDRLLEKLQEKKPEIRRTLLGAELIPSNRK